MNACWPTELNLVYVPYSKSKMCRIGLYLTPIHISVSNTNYQNKSAIVQSPNVCKKEKIEKLHIAGFTSTIMWRDAVAAVHLFCICRETCGVGCKPFHCIFATTMDRGEQQALSQGDDSLDRNPWLQNSKGQSSSLGHDKPLSSTGLNNFACGVKWHVMC